MAYLASRGAIDGGTAVLASRAFRHSAGKSGDMGMLTVYQYGFEVPQPAEPETPWGIYLAVALAGWWAWTKWGSKVLRQSNPRRRTTKKWAKRLFGGSPGSYSDPAARAGKAIARRSRSSRGGRRSRSRHTYGSRP